MTRKFINVGSVSKQYVEHRGAKSIVEEADTSPKNKYSFKIGQLEKRTKMTTITSYDIEFIKDWMAKEDHLPKNFTDVMIKKFLHSCYGSLEQTKMCIEKYCAGRLNMPEVYTDRDPMSPKVQTAFSISSDKVMVQGQEVTMKTAKSLVTYNAGDDELLIYQLDDPNLDNYDFYPALKSFSLLTDCWISNHTVYAKGHILLVDMQHFFVKIIPKINIFLFRQFILYHIEAMPIRLKEIHAFNCPPYYEKLYSLIKPALPQEICDLIHFHPTIEDIHKLIDKNYLPSELGGEAPSMKKQMEQWINKIEESRKIYLDDNLWKAIPTKKSKSMENDMNGSFRTLSID